MKRIPATPAAATAPLYPEELVRRLAGIAKRDRETSEKAREARAKTVQALRASRALRLAKIEADQAALRASLKGLEYRLSVHDEALYDLQAELDALVARTAALELARLQKSNPVR